MLNERVVRRLRCNIPPHPDFTGNIEIVDVTEPGSVSFTVDVPDSLGNYRNGIHGGTLYFIGEIGAGFATSSLGYDNVCSSATVNYFKSVPCCKLDATTEPLHAGRSTAVIRVTIRQSETGKVIAQGTHNMFLFSPFE